MVDTIPQPDLFAEIRAEKLAASVVRVASAQLRDGHPPAEVAKLLAGFARRWETQ